MLSVYTYSDYRAFLRDLLAAAKAENAAVSYRYIAKRAGFSSPNFLQLVIAGKRNLTPQSLHRFATVFKLSRRDATFFELLVYFNQAKTPEEQQHYYQRMLESPEYSEAHALADAEYRYLSRWYYPVIADLTLLENFTEDETWIVKALDGAITPAQAREALTQLHTLGLLERNDVGRLRPAHQHLTTGNEARSAAAFVFHQQMLERARHALRTQSSDEREYGAITMALTAKQLAMLKTAIRDFRRVVLNMTKPGKTAPDAVYQLNVQLFAHAQMQKKR